MSDLPSVPQLASTLQVDAKTMRSWMRAQGWRSAVEHGQPWSLTAEQVAILAAKYGPMEAPAASSNGADDEVASSEDAPTSGSDLRTPLAALTVGELLATYADVLAELRERNLIRTHNAPIGDLAEFCAATVYDGLFAPNSEKSFDLTAADGRRVQVKVRQMRPGSPRSALFSPIRSFGFDVSVFIVIDTFTNQVAAAREWSADEVREHGSFKKHTNGTTVTLSQVLAKTARGIDRTADFANAWQALLAQTR
jgi:hypothetical protein